MKSRKLSTTGMEQITTYQSGTAQSSAHRIINRIVSDFLVRYDLTAMQWFMVGHVYDAGDDGLSLSDLTEILGTSLPYTTNMITLLESKDVILKRSSDTDSRTKLVSVTRSFYPLVNEIEQGLRVELRTQLYANDHIDRAELQTYIKVLYKIVEADKQT